MTGTTTDSAREVELLGATAREFFADFVDNGYLNQQEESESGYDTGRWKQIVELGWTAVHLPERVGGAEAGLTAVAVLALEYGRAAFASPWLSTVRAATVVAELPATDRGDAVLSAVVAGVPHTLIAPADRTVHAVADGADGYRLTGAPVVVEWVTQAETVVLLLPVGPEAAAGQQDSSARWVAAAIARDRLDDRIVPVISVDNERSARVDLDGFVIAPEFVLGEIAAPAANLALATANLLRTGVIVGGSEAVLEFSVRYAGERVQFGQPIGAFQAVRHHLSRIAIAVDAARLAHDEALLILTGSEPDTTIPAVASFVAGRSYVEIVLTAAQIHGGVGTTVEHVLHHHFRRAKAYQLRSGKRGNRLRELTDALVRNPTNGLLW